MCEGGIADDRDNGTMLGAGPCKLETMGHGNGCTHIDARVHSGQRRQRTKRIAADIAGDDGLHAGKLLEHKAMRAAGAQRRRTTRDIIGSLSMRGSFLAECSADQAGRQFAIANQAARELGNLNARGANGIGQILRSLLHDVKLLDGCPEVAQRLLRQRVRDAQFED